MALKIGALCFSGQGHRCNHQLGHNATPVADKVSGIAKMVVATPKATCMAIIPWVMVKNCNNLSYPCPAKSTKAYR